MDACGLSLEEHVFTMRQLVKTAREENSQQDRLDH